MAIFHCSLRKFSRSKGYSAVSVAGYRAGSVLRDHRKKRNAPYQNKADTLIDDFIMLPEGTDEMFYDREVLWNSVEVAENRKNSCVAREVEVALVHELSAQDRLQSVVQMAQWIVKRYHTVVDATIHCSYNEKGEANHHAHILFATRRFESDAFTTKLRVLDDRVQGRKEVKAMRERWAHINNSLLQSAKLDIRIDHRSLKEQGVEITPQRKRRKQ